MTALDPLSSINLLHQQRGRLHIWIRSRLWAQVVIGMALGFGAGAVLGPDVGWLGPATAEAVGAWLALPGQLFLGLIAMVLVPIVFASIIGGLTGAHSGAELKSIGLRLTAFILVTTFAAASIGVGLALWISPGTELQGMLTQQTSSRDAPAPETFVGARAPDIIAGILPTNPTASIAQGDMLAVVILALLVGIACVQSRRERVAPFLGVLDALLSISMVIVKWAMFLTPFAVFGLMAQLVMRVGLSTVAGMSTYILTVLAGLAVLMALYLVIVAVFGRIAPMAFLKASAGNLLLAFSTSSSSAVMPMTIDTAIKRFNVHVAISNLVVPLGATMNMAGTALYQSVAILFLAQIAGVELTQSELALIVITLVASSIGAPGTPGVSIAILISVAAGFGIPAEGIVIILGVDRLLDMCRTTVNVAGDLTACIVFRNAGESPAST